MISSDIWHKYHEWYFKLVIRNFTSRLANKIWDNLKYQEWYLTAKYHPQIMLWFVTATRKRTLFKLSGTMLWKPYDFLKTSSKSSNNFLGSRPFAVYTRLFALNTEVKPITCPFVQVMYGQIYYHCGKYDVFNVIFCHLTIVSHLCSIQLAFCLSS